MFTVKNTPQIKSSSAILFADFEKSNVKLHGKYFQNTVVKHGRLCSTPDYVRVCDATYVYNALDIPEGLVYCSPTGTYIKDDVRVVRLCDTMQNPTILHCEKQSAIVFSQKSSGTFVHNGQYARALTVGFDTLAMCKERVFGANGRTVYFTEADNAANWNGQIVLPERVVAVVEQNESILAVGNSVYRVEIDGENSKVTQVVKNLGTVFPKTVQCVGNRMFFLGPDGLRCVTQNSVKKIAKEVDFHKDNNSAVGAVCDGKYYISYTRVNGSRQVLVVDCDTFEVCTYLNIDSSVLCGGNRVLFNVNDKLHTFGDGQAESVWVSNSVNFDLPTAKKYLKNLWVKTSGDVQISVVTEKGRSIYNVCGSSKLQKIPVKGAFTTLHLEIDGEGLNVEQLGVEIRKRGETNHG